MEPKDIYTRRLGGDIKFRKEMYKILCDDFFQKYIPSSATVMDIGAGYCELINAIKAKRKIALDINPDIKKYADRNVKVIVANSTNMKKIKSNSIDVACMNNFFEHLSKADIQKTVKEIHRVLKKSGKLLIIQPNIRYCYKDYWMFFDHVTPMDDRSLRELLELNGFKVMESIPKFLPFTTKSRLPKSTSMLRLYLKVPLLWKILGKQMFIYAKKE